MNLKFGKVAICISGQLRTGIKAFPSFDNFFKGLDADVFYHTWEQPSNISEEVDRLYKPKKTSVNPVFSKEEMGSFGHMLYSMMIANELKKQYEIEHNFRYDLVIKTRFDLVFPKEVNFFMQPEIYPRTIYSTGGNQGIVHTDYEHHSMSDLIFWGDSQSMDIATNIFMYYKHRVLMATQALYNGYRFDPIDIFQSPGTLMYTRIARRNIACERFVLHVGEIPWREDVSHLDPLNDYKLIRERYMQS